VSLEIVTLKCGWVAGTQSSTCHNVGRIDGHILDSLIIHDMDWLQAQYVGSCSVWSVFDMQNLWKLAVLCLWINVIFYDTFFWIHKLRDGDCLILMDPMEQVI